MSSKALMHLKELITKKTPVLSVMISNMQITEKYRQAKVYRDQKFAKWLVNVVYDGLIRYVTVFLELIWRVVIMKRARGNTNVHYIRMKATLFCFGYSMLHSVKEPLSGKIPFLPGVYKSITYNFEFMICLCLQKIIKSCKEILYIKKCNDL